jgi:hypothetical protein
MVSIRSPMRSPASAAGEPFWMAVISPMVITRPSVRRICGFTLMSSRRRVAAASAVPSALRSTVMVSVSWARRVRIANTSA